MRFAITAEQRTFFERNQFITFEELLPSAQSILLQQDASQALAQKLGIPIQRIAQETPLQLFQAGYHLHVTEPSIKRIAQKSAFAEIMAHLTLQPAIRFGFDQYILVPRGSPPPFSDRLSLQQTSCLSPLAGALILPLKDLETPLDFFPMPQKAGDALFISATFPIPWPELFATEGLCFYVIGFALQRTFFKAGSPDPLANELKKLGYAFNDLLKEPLHPLLYIDKN